MITMLTCHAHVQSHLTTRNKPQESDHSHHTPRNRMTPITSHGTDGTDGFAPCNEGPSDFDFSQHRRTHYPFHLTTHSRRGRSVRVTARVTLVALARLAWHARPALSEMQEDMHTHINAEMQRRVPSWDGRYEAAGKWEVTHPRHEAGPLNHLGDEVDPDQ